MLKLRVVTAVVLAAVALWAIYGWPPIWFSVFLLTATFSCCWEWAALLNIESPRWKLTYAAGTTVTSALLFYSDSTTLLRVMVLVAVLCWIAIAIDLILRPVIEKTRAIRWLLLFVATLLLVTAVWSLFWMREHQSAHVIVYLIALVAAADIGAYFSGRQFGRRKLAAYISGGKTIEGAMGGIAIATLLALVVLTVFSLSDQSVPSLLFFSLLAALFSIAGDLFISRAKRTRGVKDSGNLLPGHGGVLDRFDGLQAAVPWLAFAMMWT
jgi:phosphatidate cytidylyltransferase